MFTKQAVLAGRIHIAITALVLVLLTGRFLPNYAGFVCGIIVAAALVLWVILPCLCRHTLVYVQGSLLCVHTGNLFSKTTAYPLPLCSFVFFSTPLLKRLDLIVLLVRSPNHRLVLPYLPSSAQGQLYRLLCRCAK